MPIKFRCSECRQFLGISRAKAGQLVDCPTCGRTVRVPWLDGRMEPVPKPALNLHDSQLAKALDELAMIGQDAADDADLERPPLALGRGPHKVHALEPVPLPEPIPIEAPLPAEPVVKAAPAPPPAASLQAAAKERVALQSPAVRHDSAAPLSPERELAALASMPAHSVVPTTVRGSSTAEGWRLLLAPVVVATFLMGTVVAFGIGYLAGRSGGSGAASASVENASNSNLPREGNAQPKATSSSTERPPALKGRITFKNAAGDSRPDRGARVIVFPEQRPGEAKLSIVGFRAGDSSADFQLAQAGLRALGGDVAVADDEGNFEIALPAAGSYQILVISRFQSRDDDAPVAAALRNVLAAYFDRPEQLLGRVRYHFGQVRYKGEGSEIWDHSFERTY